MLWFLILHEGKIYKVPWEERIGMDSPRVKEHGPVKLSGKLCYICLPCFHWILSVQFSRSVMSKPLQPHGQQQARPPCPSPTPRVYSNSCPLSRWCHPTISSSAVPFSSRLQSFPAAGSFLLSGKELCCEVHSLYQAPSIMLSSEWWLNIQKLCENESCE